MNLNKSGVTNSIVWVAEAWCRLFLCATELPKKHPKATENTSVSHTFTLGNKFLYDDLGYCGLFGSSPRYTFLPPWILISASKLQLKLVLNNMGFTWSWVTLAEASGSSYMMLSNLFFFKWKRNKWPIETYGLRTERQRQVDQDVKYRVVSFVLVFCWRVLCYLNNDQKVSIFKKANIERKKGKFVLQSLDSRSMFE